MPPDTAPMCWTAERPDPDAPAAGLGVLGGAEHQAVLVAHPEIGTYNHVPRLIRRGEHCVIMWRNHERDPHAPGQRVLFSRSADGVSWEAPQPLFQSLSPMEDIGGTGVLISPDRFYVFEDRCYAAARAWWVEEWMDDSGHSKTRRGDYHLHNIPVRRALPKLLLRLDEDGVPLDSPFWLADASPPGLERIPPGTAESKHTLADVMRILRRDREDRAARWAPLASGAWLRPAGRYARADGAEVTLLQSGDDGPRFCAALRRAGGERWSAPLETDVPDSGAPVDIETLPDGQVLLVGNLLPEADRRDVLILASSPDGIVFDHAWALRSGGPPMRFAGLGKRPGPQAPALLLDGETLLVAYAQNQEDIVVAHVPVASVSRHATVSGPEPGTADNGEEPPA